MNIYLQSGYLDIESILAEGIPFNFIVCGRGIGKTFGVCKHLAQHPEKPFMFWRRSQTQVDNIMLPGASPFKDINPVTGTTITPTKAGKNLYSFYNVDDEGKPSGPLLGYATGMSTIHNLRGQSFSDVEIIFYDEFIPEKVERPIADEANAFFNAYETINRNREIDGKPPCQLVACANSNQMANPLFLSLGLVRTAIKLEKSGGGVWVAPDRTYQLIVLKDSPISEKKKTTALYRLTANTDYGEMALKNEFTDYDESLIKPRPLKEYRPLVSCNELTIYRHKSRLEYYGCKTKSGSPETFTVSDSQLLSLRKKYWFLQVDYVMQRIYFDDFVSEVLFKKYFGIKGLTN